MRQQGWDRFTVGTVSLALAMVVNAVAISGCGAVKEDVHQYYQQMARNYHDAQEKAKQDAISLNSQSRGYLETGDVNKYNRARKQLARIRDWEARCAYQQERFEKAARMLEPGPTSGATPDRPAEPPPVAEPASTGG